MKYEYDIDEVVILDGVVDGVRFKREEAIIVVQLNDHTFEQYKYTVKVKKSGGRWLHTGSKSLRDVNDYSHTHMEMTSANYIRSNSGDYCFHITEDIIVESLSKKKKEYDPSQQPWDEGDI